MAVRDYYDANTWKFLLAGGERTIHRELWGPGVTNRGAAVHHAHALVLDELADGAGASSTSAAGSGPRRSTWRSGGRSRWSACRSAPTRYGGPSGSPRGGGPLRGTRPVRDRRLHRAAEDLTGFDLALAIESFVHADPAPAFFAEAARALRPGGALVVIDDVRVGDPADPRARRRADRLARADPASRWPRPQALAAEAAWTWSRRTTSPPYQRLGRPRDRLIRAAPARAAPRPPPSAWAESLVGGDALQRCHRAGLLEYRLLRFERATP